jgi:hypothetical protein
LVGGRLVVRTGLAGAGRFRGFGSVIEVNTIR